MVELFVVIVTIALLAALFLPMLINARAKASRISCTSNLKQVGLAFRIFAGDNDDKYPFEATNSIAFQRTSNAWVYFQAMSNELASAKILMCPKDSRRFNFAATDFSNTAMGLMSRGKQDLSVSYFVGLGADELRPKSILTGDRNMATAESISAYSSYAQGGAIQVGSKSTWSTNMIHRAQGNIVFGDASVGYGTSRWLSDQLQVATNLYGITNNYLLFPQ